MENRRNEEKVIIKINNKVIKRENISINEQEIEMLKKVLFNNNISLCKSCNAKVCLANRKELTGPIFEGIADTNTSLITRCANYR